MMNILLDTHAIKWFFDGDERLSQSAIDAICHYENDVYVSVASLWEVAIKLSIGKLQVNGGIDKFIEAVYENGFILLDVAPEHISTVTKLPFIHRDPFDRMLVAQALIGDMAIITVDPNIKGYNVTTIW